MTNAGDIQAIAEGRNPVWEQSFDHRVHGSLSFRGTLPTAKQQMLHAIAMDNLLATLDDEAGPRGGTLVLVAAMAGLRATDATRPSRGLLLELPAVAERKVEDPESGKVTVHRSFYDVDAETDIAFPVSVWVAYSEWCDEQLSEKAVDAVKGPSGATG